MDTQADTPQPSDILAMSDEDIMNMAAPPESLADLGSAESGDAGDTNEDPAPESGAGENDDPAAGEASEDGGDPEGADTGESDDAGTGEDGGDGNADPVVNDKSADGPKAGEADPAGPEAEKSGTEPEVKVVTAEEAQSFYEKIMTPFKANGKTIELRTPEEAIQLMQMGANYTRKLQDLQPHRKTLLMLQNNDLLDPERLSFLIDLDKKDPEAIKKLIKDSGIDPMDIDTSVDPVYLGGNHQVSDEEANFRTVLDDVTSTDNGKELVRLINTEWDQASKDVLWKSPEIMTVIQEQRENGIFDTIKAEMDRQRMLGKISADTPFLQAYKIVGDELAEAKAFGDLGEPATVDANKGNPGGNPEPKVVATRTAAPKNPVANEDKASAASPTRSTPRPAKAVVNPLAMSDDEFLSQMNGRL